MNRWERVEEVFHKVADLSPGDQTRIVGDLCAGDTWVRARVMELVHADRGATSHSLARLEASAVRVRSEVEAGAGPRPLPARIGEYAIRARLGQGGFGTVYLAQQEKPVRRTLALKVIRPGFDTDLILSRFESERRTLALLDHPNIARMVSVGQTDEGLPYFSMEFVDGRAITAFCDESRLSITDRLRLFIGVCRAIHHAHQKGVVHRDIKPGNVLVTLVDGKPVAKVIDFGIAKVLHATDDWGATLASVGQFIGTPEYMSPEQARTGGQDVDTRSDVYALGVLLHELATGVLPFDRDALRKAGPVHACRIIAETDPPTPTQRLKAARTRASDLARDRALDGPGALERAVRGDLSSIITKATAREPQRRYASAEDLAADVERLLAEQPIVARGAGLAYRAWKFVQRHRVGVAAAVAAVLLLGSVAWSVQRTVHDRRAARESSVKAQARAYDDMVASVARAEGAIARGDESTARAALLAVPEHLRGWEWRVLRGMLIESRVLRTEQRTPLHMAINPQGTLIATGAYFKRIDVFRADTGAQVMTLNEDEPPAWAPGGIAWSPDGTLLAAGVKNGVWIGDPLSPADARTLALPGFAVSLAWSKDQSRLACVRYASGGRDGVCVLDAATGEVLVDGLAPHSHYVLLHPTRPVVFWGDIAGYLHGYDYEAGREVLLTRVCGDGVNAVRLTPDGRRIAAASSCSTIAFFDVDSYDLVDKIKTPRTAIDIGFSPDGRLLYASSMSTLVDAFSLATGSLAYSFPGGKTMTQALVVHPVSGDIFTGGPAEEVRVTRPRADAIDLGIGAGGSMPTAMPHGDRVVVQEDSRHADPAQPQGYLRMFDAGDGSLVDTVECRFAVGWRPVAAGVPGERGLFWYLGNGSLTLRDADARRDVCSMPVPPAYGIYARRGSPSMFLTLHSGGWWVLDARTGEVLQKVPVHPAVWVENFSETGRTAQCSERLTDAATTRDGDEAVAVFTLRDAMTGEVTGTLEPAAYTGYFQFTEDDLLCAAGGFGVPVFDTRTGLRVAHLAEPEKGDHGWVKFLDGGRRLAAIAPSGRLQVWDTATWRPVASLPASGLSTVLEDDSLAVIGWDRLLRVMRPDARPLEP